MGGREADGGALHAVLRHRLPHAVHQLVGDADQLDRQLHGARAGGILEGQGPGEDGGEDVIMLLRAAAVASEVDGERGGDVHLGDPDLPGRHLWWLCGRF